MTALFCEDCIVDFKQDVINMLIQTIEKKDTYTSGHSNRVSLYSLLIAHQIELSYKEKDKLSQAALMHDIGKIFTPKSILQKKGKLTDEEYVEVQEHAHHGWEMLKEIRLFKEHATIVRHHHEWYDGSGYPDALKGYNIPLLSRIIAIADAFDAMTSQREYQRSYSYEEAYKELQRCSGTQFDPQLVPVAIKAFNTYFYEQEMALA